MNTIIAFGARLLGVLLFIVSSHVHASPIFLTSIPPKEITNVSGTAYFSYQYGFELWKTDGTRNGTVQVWEDFYIPFTQPRHLTELNGTLHFILADELWKTDGTFSGTEQVKHIGSDVSSMLEVNGTLFIATETDELWKSNGTSAGTVRIKDIYDGVRNSDPEQLTQVGRNLFFVAEDPFNGKELWKSDGSRSGTELVKDINSGQGAPSSDPRHLTDVNGTLFFTAYDGSDRGLWKSNGYTTGTVKVSNRAGSKLTNVGGELFYFSFRELWKSDGTTTGTVKIKDVDPGGAAPTNVDGVFYFSAEDPSNETGYELWKSDGTVNGTKKVKEINPDHCFLCNGSTPSHLTDVYGVLYFAADDGNYGEELWKSDGSASGTIRVTDIDPGVNDAYPEDLTVINGNLFFEADGDLYSLWKANGPKIGLNWDHIRETYRTVGATGTWAYMESTNVWLYSTDDLVEEEMVNGAASGHWFGYNVTGFSGSTPNVNYYRVWKN